MGAVAIRNRGFDDLASGMRAKQFEANCIQHRAGTRLNDVVRNTDRSPGALVVCPLHEHANFRRCSTIAIQHADFVVPEPDFVEPGIVAGEAFPQRIVKGVEGALAAPGRGAEVTLIVNDDACHGFRLALSVCLGRNIESNEREEALVGKFLLQDEQLEVAFGYLKVVALMLHLFDVLEQTTASLFVQSFGNAV
jgi:hypothetical protein